MRMKQLQNDVTKVLEEIPESRDSDMVLYAELCKRKNAIACYMPFTEVLLHIKDYGLPNIESVGRARRKAQEQNPSLRATDKVYEARQMLRAEVQNYALQ